MPIHIKLAKTAKEIDDALWLRHEVFVIEDGKFGGEPLHGNRLVDRFDAFPNAYHVVAYEDGEPIAAMRLLKDSDVGMPCDELYDFSTCRAQARAGEIPVSRRPNAPKVPVEFGSAGMLAIRGPWRRRRDVIRAMFRMAATVCHRYGATHILVAVNYETAGMYRRLGFTQLSEKIWIEEIGNHIIPLVGTTEDFVDWAFAGLNDTALSAFQDSFERMVYRAGETVFLEGDSGEHAYVVDSGEIRIARQHETGEELTLTHLKRGELFGELALIDWQPRSASALAVTDSELMTLDRETFQEQLRTNPDHCLQLFRVFSQRVRAMDELAMVLAFAPAGQRLDFALEIARQQASPDRANPGHLLFRGGPREFALLAAVEEQAATEFLEREAAAAHLEFSARHISFPV
ncbi:MAG: cyclic nucleotide-binding domain-containing protein [Gammaproteobacteria bacterium]